MDLLSLLVRGCLDYMSMVEKCRYDQKQTMSCRSQREERGDSDMSHRKSR